MIWVELVELHDPGISDLGRILDCIANRQVGDRCLVRHHAPVRERCLHVDQAFEGARRHDLGVEGIDDVVAVGARQGLDLLLDRESRIGRRSRHRRRATDFLSARQKRCDLVSRNTQQSDRQFRGNNVAVTVPIGIAGVLGTWRTATRRWRGIARDLGKCLGSSVLRRLFEICNAGEFRSRRGWRRCRRRGRRGFVRALGVGLRFGRRGGVSRRAHCLGIDVVHQLHIADGREKLLRVECLVDEVRARGVACANQVESVAGQDDLAPIGEQQHEIDVQCCYLDVRSGEIELQMRAGRHFDYGIAPGRRTIDCSCLSPPRAASGSRSGRLWISCESKVNWLIGHLVPHPKRPPALRTDSSSTFDCCG